MEEIASLFSLRGKRILVGGASRGIGHALANGLATAGAEVVGFGRTAGLDQAGFDYRQCDATSDEQVKALFAGMGALDGYLHVAGMTLPAVGGMQDTATFVSTLQSNLVAAYRCCALAAHSMMPAGFGSIVTVTSIGSLQAFPGNPGYVASKGGMKMMSKALALDMGAHGIRVNSLVPGYIHTDMTARSFADPELNRQRAERTMLGRWGQTSDLLGAAIFLLSDASRYVTGSDLVVDGGWTAKGL